MSTSSKSLLLLLVLGALALLIPFYASTKPAGFSAAGFLDAVSGAYVTVSTQNPLPTGFFTSSGDELNTDSATNNLVITQQDHHEVHEGCSFFIKNTVDLTNAQVLDFLTVTPNTTEWAHMIVQFAFEAEATVVIYEGTTTSADGSAVTVYNRNRNSAHTNTTLVYTGPTVTSVGTQIASYKAGAGKAVGGETRALQELVLKQNTKYLIRVTNDTTSNNWFDYLADWYEHTNE